jgi:hypothetical protein
VNEASQADKTFRNINSDEDTVRRNSYFQESTSDYQIFEYEGEASMYWYARQFFLLINGSALCSGGGCASQNSAGNRAVPAHAFHEPKQTACSLPWRVSRLIVEQRLAHLSSDRGKISAPSPDGLHNLFILNSKPQSQRLSSPNIGVLSRKIDVARRNIPLR